MNGFRTNEDRREPRAEIVEQIASAPAAQAARRNGWPCSRGSAFPPVRSTGWTRSRSTRVAATRDFFYHADVPAAACRRSGWASRFDGQLRDHRTAPPGLGEHTHTVLRELLGLDARSWTYCARRDTSSEEHHGIPGNLYAEDGPIGTITLNRPHDGNMFTPQMCHEIRDCINDIRRETRTRVHRASPAPATSSSASAAARRAWKTPRCTPACCRRWKCTRASTGCKSP